MKRGRGDLSSLACHVGAKANKRSTLAGPVLLANRGLIDPRTLPTKAASNLPKWWIEPKSQ